MDETYLQTVATEACDFLGIPAVKITVKGGVRRGRAHIKNNTATVPAWALKLHIGYAIYYTLHETVHFRMWKHGPEFQALERDLCAHFGIILFYRRVFPDALVWEGKHISCAKKDIKKANS